MNDVEVLEVLAYAAELWPAFALPADDDRLDLRVLAWSRNLGDRTKLEVLAALDSLAQRDFVPPVGLIRQRVGELHATIAGIALPDWDEFWRWARGWASKASLFLYDDKPAFACPWPELAELVTPAVLAEWATAGGEDGGMTAHDLEMVEQAHLRRRFDATIERAKAVRAGDAPAVAAWKDAIKRLDEGDEPPALAVAP